MRGRVRGRVTTYYRAKPRVPSSDRPLNIKTSPARESITASEDVKEEIDSIV